MQVWKMQIIFQLKFNLLIRRVAGGRQAEGRSGNGYPKALQYLIKIAGTISEHD